MNDELCTISLNLHHALSHADWDAVVRATERLGAYVMDTPVAEVGVWEEKYLDAETRLATWRDLALSRDKTIAELKKRAAEDEQLRDHIAELERQLEVARSRISAFTNQVLADSQLYHKQLDEYRAQLNAAQERAVDLEQLLEAERAHSTRLYEAANERENELINENVRLDLALKALEEDEAILHWRAAYNDTFKAWRQRTAGSTSE